MAQDYTDIGLNTQLNNNDSIINQGTFVNSIAFDSNYDNFSATKIPDTFKIVQRGSIIVTRAANTTVGHGTISVPTVELPAVFAWGFDPTLVGNIYGHPVPFNTFDTNGQLNQQTYFAIGPNEVVFSVLSGTYSSSYSYNGTINYQYFILREKGKA